MSRGKYPAATSERGLVTVQLEIQEIWAHCRPTVQRNRKKYSRKNKKNDDWKKEI